jgi:glycosyltransferase involved in cell wall biosynthesis
MTEQTESANIKTEPRPLLSICIPTYNRAIFLKIMLQALLPQVKECGDLVEVWILDNASEDNTQEVLEQCKTLGPFRVKRQPSNLGPTSNIVEGPSKQATGKYAWVLGDHNLLRPGTLRRILNRLKENDDFDVFYVNYRAASYPDQWPESAIGGHDGPFNYIGNPEVKDGPIKKWSDLLTPNSAICTQNYVHIVTTSTWRDFWKHIRIGMDYSSAQTTYPHTMMLIETKLNSQAMVISEPCFTIFNGAQSWGNPETKFKVYFIGLIELLIYLETSSLPKLRTDLLWKDFFYPESKKLIRETARLHGRLYCLSLFLRNRKSSLKHRAFLLNLLSTLLLPRALSCGKTLDHLLKNYQSSYIYNCRPARWIRNHL